jgi:hypothetical protein
MGDLENLGAARPSNDTKLAEKVRRMIQPELLKQKIPLVWSPGTGSDVWEMFCACIEGDLETVKQLVDRDPSLARCNFAYRTPIYFAVRENQIGVAAFLLEHGADALSQNLPGIARDRGYVDLEKFLESKFASLHGASSKGEPVAAAIRERDLAKVRSLLDADPKLLHAGDATSNQPIHWAVMTRQLDMIDELLARGADIDSPRQDGARPIQLTNGDYNYRGWRDVPQDWPTTPAQVLAHLRARSLRRHLYGLSSRRTGTGEGATRQRPDSREPCLGIRHLLPGLRIAAEKRRGRASRNRRAVIGTRRRSEFARGGDRAAGPRAVFGGRQWAS